MAEADAQSESVGANGESPGRRSGKPLVFATLSLFVVVPAMVYLSRVVLVAIEPSSEVVLAWSERSRWPEQPIRASTLRAGPMTAMRTQSEFRKIRFDLPAEAELMLQRAGQIARDPTELDSPEGAAALTALLAEWDALLVEREARGQRAFEGEARPPESHRFYVEYLLGVRASRAGDAKAAGVWFDRAFRNAPAAIVRRYVDAAGQPAAGGAAPVMALALDRVIDGVRDTSLVLWFPSHPLDERGQAYWPAYRMIYREAAPDALPGEVDRADEAWFTFPGPVGRMPDAAAVQAVPSSP